MSGESTPTLRSELRRGVSAYNLGVAFVAAILISAFEYGLSLAGFVPVLIGATPVTQAFVTGAGLFTVISLMHIAVHAYFGWRFQRGVAAFAEGDPVKALRLLAIAERPGMDHYDEQGSIRRVVRSLRADEGGHR
jgi:hypothetical protein